MTMALHEDKLGPYDVHEVGRRARQKYTTNSETQDGSDPLKPDKQTETLHPCRRSDFQ